jgi:hypothetical protein
MKQIVLLIIFVLIFLTGISLAHADTTPPTIPIVTDDGQYSTSSTQLHAIFSSSDPESGISGYKYCIGTAPGLNNVVNWISVGVSTENPQESVEVTKTGLNLVEGQIYYFTVMAKNTVGLWSLPGLSDGITVDAWAPQGSITINNNENYTNSTAVILTLSALDVTSGMGQGAQMKFSNDKVVWSQPEDYAVTKNWSLSNGDGYKMAYVKFKDVAGNWSQVFADGITLDTTPPQAPTINALTTPTGIPTQTISGTKEANTSIWLNNQEAIPLNAAVVWSYQVNLSVGDNPLSIFCKDIAGNVSPAIESNIFYDATPPTQPEVTDDGTYTASNTQLHATWSSQDPETGIQEYLYAVGTTQGENGIEVIDWTSIGVNTEVTLEGLNLSEGQVYYFNVKSRNGANLFSQVGSSDGIIPDITAPQGSILINSGDEYVAQPEVTLTLSAQDQVSGLNQMQFSNDNTNWSQPQAYTNTKQWTLPDQQGTRIVYVKFSDNIGNWSQSYSDTIFFDNTPPVISEVIDDGEVTYNRSQLHASWSAQNEGAPITEYLYAIGTSQGPNGTDILSWASSGLNTEVTAQNLNLTVNQVYYFNVKAQNEAGLWSDVGSSDGISIGNQPPQITSLSPENNSTFIEEDLIEISVQAQDPDNDDLEYRYLVEGEVIQDWTNQASYSWQTEAGDVKLKSISVQARDEFGAEASSQTQVFLYRKVPQPQ